MVVLSKTSMLLPTGSLTVCRGSGLTRDLKVKDLCGKPVPLDNAVLYLCVKNCLDDEFVVLMLSSKNPSEIQILDPVSAGCARIFFPAVLLDAGEYVYDVILVLPDNPPFCIVEASPFTVTKGVTQLSA